MASDIKRLYYFFQFVTAGVMFIVSGFVAAAAAPFTAIFVLVIGIIISVPVSLGMAFVTTLIPEIGVGLLYGSLLDSESREELLLRDDLHKAERLIREGQLPVALEMLNWLVAENPENSEIRFRTATVYESLGYRVMALKHYRALSRGTNRSAPKNAYVLESERAISRILEESRSVPAY